MLLADWVAVVELVALPDTVTGAEEVLEVEACWLLLSALAKVFCAEDVAFEANVCQTEDVTAPLTAETISRFLV